MAILEIDPDDSNTILCGGLRVWRTKNDAASWTAVSSILDGSPVSAVEIAQIDLRRIYVGTENGGVFAALMAGAAGVEISPDRFPASWSRD